MDPVPAPPADDAPAAPPQRKRFGLPPATPPIKTPHTNWTAKELAYALCGGVKGAIGHAGANDVNAIHNAWMDVIKLLPTHILAGLYNEAFLSGDNADDSFWQESALAAKLLNQDG